MQRRLKSLLRRSTSHKRDDQPPQAERTSGGSTPDGRHGSTTSRIRDRVSTAFSSEASSRGGSSQHESRSESLQRPYSFSNEPTIASTDYGMPSPEDIDGSVADDYSAYLPALSSQGDVSRDSRYMSLGGDSRHRIGASEMKYSEDIADRNIDMYGSSSRHGSLPSQNDVEVVNGSINHAENSAQGKQVGMKAAPRKGSEGNYSMGSVGSPRSIGSIGSVARYALGTGIPTEGGLIDSIRPHQESSHKSHYNRKDWPSRVARNDLRRSWQRRKPRGCSDDDLPRTRQASTQGSSHSSQSGEEPSRHDHDLIDLRSAVMDGQEEFDSYDGPMSLDLDGVINISSTEDVDKSTRFAPAVTHEVVKPHEHHVREEQIYREIHNYDVYHRIQPVSQTEILPSRHFIHDADGNLVEITEDQIPERTGEFQSWYIGKKETPAFEPTLRFPRIKEPEVVSDIKYMTPEGFERRETTIVHPPELEDMSGYGGPVVPIEFYHDDPRSPAEERQRRNKALNYLGDSQLLTLRELEEALPTKAGAEDMKTEPDGKNETAPDTRA
ncbi:hypothetical protein K458DRAFT_426479 [Lentithecium fluviatile CBS 122367]|uniref:Uncharacterized protein n=1 Tax=Lentithecium fluviatile CBS 122367 TaxID=1168545 RepID=A0A6G1JKU4_9PLEO|nr:hypothetical protein K458DRAFT_426479 [Lentithecium fluviatile CBS 122367]